MKKAILIIVVLMLGTVLVACPSDTPMVSEPQPSQPPVQFNGITDMKPPEDMSWINPGKVIVTGFYPGARAESTLLLYNGGDTKASFSITCRPPDNLKDGYTMPPPEALGWVTVEDPLPTLEPKETKALLIVLEMPEKATSPPEQWEFWISVFDTSQTGFVVTELASRWLITMRE